MIRLIFPIIYFIILCSCGQSSGNKISSSTTKDTITDFTFRSLSQEEVSEYNEAIKEWYNTNLEKRGFNGSILVAKNGQVLFEDYKGIYNFKTQEPITEHTPFHLASISKTFTGMTILKLWEEGRLSLEDTLQKFFPQLPYHGVTIKMLLCHRSGLPNYFYFMDSIWNKKQMATNWDVVNFMITHKPRADALPGKVYHYCNTNFMLLALIIEIATRKPYPQYMKDSVFTPLGLKDSYVFSITDTANYIPTYSVTKPFLLDHLDCTYGDKNVYSTVKDLFTWDKVLYRHIYLRKETMDSAYLPYSNERKSMHNYGLAWHLFFNKGDTIIYHNGKWHGSNTVFTRFIKDTASVIILGNKMNKNIYLGRELEGVFTGKSDTIKLEE